MPAKKRVASVALTAKNKKKLKSVTKVISGSQCFSQQVRRILSKTAADSLGVFKEERHELQTTIVGMIGEVVTTAEKDLQDLIASTQAKVDELKGEHDTLAAELERLTIDHKAKADAEEAAKKAFDESAAALAQLEQMKTKKAPWEEAPAKLEAVKEAAAESAAPVRELVKCGKELSLDSLIVETFSAAAKKAPDARSTFEKYAMGEFANAVLAKVSELKAIDTGDDTIAAAKAKKEELQGILSGAKAAAKEAKDAEHHAKRPVYVKKGDIKKAEEAFLVVDKKLQYFQGKPLTAYKDLLDLEKPQPPPAPVEPEAAPPAAAE